MSRITRKIVHIDEDKCTGCGLCIPNCAEGAIRIVDGKARLVADKLCDGLGACLGHCPADAIRIEERPADEFDEELQNAKCELRNRASERPGVESGSPSESAILNHHAGCPGARMRMMGRTPAEANSQSAIRPYGRPHGRNSQLSHWPVQLALAPTGGPIWQDADVLICADCVPFAYADFHEKLLAGRSVAIACPKLDDIGPYIQKLSTIFAGNTIRSITVAHMEVPCCSGIVYAVQAALEQSGRDIPVTDVTVGIDGTLQQ